MRLLTIILVLIGILAIGGVIYLIWNSYLEVTDIPTSLNSIDSKPVNDNPIIGSKPIINISTIIAREGNITISENILQDGNMLMDVECELDIINTVGIKVVDFQSFYNNEGIMQYVWYATRGEYTLSQYCWRGLTLDLNKIYSNSTIIIT